MMILLKNTSSYSNFLTKENTPMVEASFEIKIEFDLGVHEDEIFGESRGGVLASHTYEDTLSKYEI
jgi:predicted alpha/beta superfamily hydrolase